MKISSYHRKSLQEQEPFLKRLKSAMISENYLLPKNLNTTFATERQWTPIQWNLITLTVVQSVAMVSFKSLLFVKKRTHFRVSNAPKMTHEENAHHCNSLSSMLLRLFDWLIYIQRSSQITQPRPCAASHQTRQRMNQLPTSRKCIICLNHHGMLVIRAIHFNAQKLIHLKFHKAPIQPQAHIELGGLATSHNQT